jgi:hypothetical protein
MGKSTISMAIFNSYVSLPEGNNDDTELRISSFLDQQLTDLQVTTLRGLQPGTLETVGAKSMTKRMLETC